MSITGITRMRRDRTKELQENRSVKVEKYVQTEADRERLKRESEAFFKRRGEEMRGGRP